jgi:hypothetical protein
MGGLAAAAAAIVIFFLCRKSRGARNLPADAWEGPDPENMTDKPAKSGLKGGMDNDFPSIPPSRRQSLIQRSNRTGVTAGRTFKSTDTLKEVISPSSPSQNKFAVPAETFSGVRSSVDTFVESIPALPYNSDHRRWSVSVQYAENANYSRPRSANSSGNSMNVNRVMNRGDSVDGHNGYSRRSSVDGHNGYSPPASGEGERPGSRPGSGHSSIHRTRRKPVPAYDPLELSSAPTVHNEHPNSNADGLLSEHHSHTVNSTDPVNQRNMVGSNHKGNSGEIPPNRSVDNPNPDMPTPSEC